MNGGFEKEATTLEGILWNFFWYELKKVEGMIIKIRVWWSENVLDFVLKITVI